ncbi:SDR family oxidoreductase [Streptomyces sp. YC504]|uniref:SDR family oxidoreductase n=1 Tax=Streptomyces mesophilus TaxID=1775132 RepID=A0A6G4XB81_9ACTN|nr:SDR family NAD(P)-dependent oxidoreductase [Streptomyces mesophilus]NGO74110.1 SDR family oxidoreductase [Streptomyces mesophilus]
MSERFEGKVALVTGGGSGIGAACVRQLAREGAHVVALDTDKDGAQRVAAYDKVRIRAVHADVTDADAMRHAVDDLMSEHGRLDIAVNNAGVLGGLAPVHELAYNAFQHVLEVNLGGVFHGMRYEIPAMLASGGGVVVNMASVGSASGFAGASAYCAAKHAVLGLTRSAALEYAAHGVRVVAVAPAFVDTAIGHRLPPEQSAALAQQLVSAQGIQRPGTAEEVAELTCFLASDAASFVTGSFHPVDAGYLAH